MIQYFVSAIWTNCRKRKFTIFSFQYDMKENAVCKSCLFDLELKERKTQGFWD